MGNSNHIEGKSDECIGSLLWIGGIILKNQSTRVEKPDIILYVRKNVVKLICGNKVPDLNFLK